MKSFPYPDLLTGHPPRALVCREDFVGRLRHWSQLAFRQGAAAGSRLVRLACLLAWVAIAWSGGASAASAQAGALGYRVLIEQMTWTDLRAAQASGVDTVLVPIGGTEQNGPHMALGKHNIRVMALASQIAQALGRAVVAPVLAYVPEGSISPPSGHMRFTGTISIPEATFESVLSASAESFKQHGFRHIVFLGDHGGYQKSMERVAARLNQSWRKQGDARALALRTFYDSAQGPFNQKLRDKGFSDGEIGVHAGLADTALAMAIDPALVNTSRLALAAQGGKAQGVDGDPRQATVPLGEIGIRLIVDNSVLAVQTWIGKP